jgi:DNA-binding transcriptional LysR family regulator
LIAFEACVRLGSVTRAAEELSLAQPTVSGLLRRLSDTVGAPVVESRDGRMEATEAGRGLEILCVDVLDALERFESLRLLGLGSPSSLLAAHRERLAAAPGD